MWHALDITSIAGCKSVPDFKMIFAMWRSFNRGCTSLLAFSIKITSKNSQDQYWGCEKCVSDMTKWRSRFLIFLVCKVLVGSCRKLYICVHKTGVHLPKASLATLYTVPHWSWCLFIADANSLLQTSYTIEYGCRTSKGRKLFNCMLDLWFSLFWLWKIWSTVL
jgi:hypothetical protein